MKTIIPLLFLLLPAFSFAQSDSKNGEQSEQMRSDKTTTEKATDMQGQISTFLTFQKEDAEQAMNFYMELFDNSEVISIQRWGEGGPGKEGTIMHATFTLNGRTFMCSDSPPIHAWGFTPAVSNFVECTDEAQIDMLYTKLSADGKQMMPLNNYGFSQKFAFVEDRFGVSWQLNLK